jgi:quinol monooxygenase YgiN
MIHHVVLFRLLPNFSSASLEALISVLSGLKERLDGVEEYRVGQDLRLRDNNDDFAIVARFRDRKALDTYLTHPEHLSALAKYGPALVAEKHSVQFEDGAALPEAAPAGVP